MKRRDFLHLAASSPLIASCGGGGGSSGSPPPPPGARPNVLMIVIDDLNDWVGYLGGHPQVQTPHLDALAARSTAFQRAYCNNPLCNPSRSSALSGLSVQDTGVQDNFTSLSKARPGATLLPAWMTFNGYSVAQYGKINHVYTASPEVIPATLPATNLQCSGYPDVQPEGLFDWKAMDITDDQMPDYHYAQSGIDFLGQSHAAPFMLCVGLIRSHLAWFVPKPWVDMYPIDSIELPVVPANDLDDLSAAAKKVALAFNAQSCITSQGLWPSAVQHFLASVSFVDAQVGRLMAALDASAHADNTIVVLWSDNGFHLGQKFHWFKQALWEPATRVPFLVRRPGQSVGGTVDAAVGLQDMMPTVLDLCGVTAPYTLAGRSLRPLLTQPTLAWDHPVLMTNAVMDAQNKFATSAHDYAIRTNQWRYIRYHDGSQELYDELADDQEYTNLASDSANAPLMAQLDALMPAS